MLVTRQTIEYGSVRLGLGNARPRLSWTASGRVGERQRAYEIELARTNPTGPDELTSSGRIDTDQSAWVDWPFAALTSRQRFGWRLRLWGVKPEPGDWSDWQWAETGLLEPGDWTVPWIVFDRRQPTADPAGWVRPGVRGRVKFTLPDNPDRIRLYLTGHGVYTAEINGRPVSDELLAPGWTDYHHRVVYRGVDLDDLVQPGVNVLGVNLADGWYRGRLGFNGGVQDTYGDDLAILAQLDVLVDGTWRQLLDPAAWRRGPSPVTAAALYEGQGWDSELDQPGWSAPGFDDHGWSGVETVALTGFPGRPVAATLPPTRVTESLSPVAVERRDDGWRRFDFGQNIAGRLALPLTAGAATSVTLRHAEVLEDDQLARRPLRRARAEDTISLRAGDRLSFAPDFTSHGFRYAEIHADPERVDLGPVTAEVVHTDMVRTGWFECSDARLNQLHDNTVWSTRDNFGSLPTDCPQRDERLGWTGDIQAFAPTARYLFDCSGVLVNWLADVVWAQRDLGTVPNFVPWLELGFPVGPTSVWGDAIVIVPWVLYERGGDRQPLIDNYQAMRAWVDQVDALGGASGLVQSGPQLGDWLDPEAPAEAPDLARTDPFLVATAYHAHSARLLAQIAGLLGHTDDQRHYAALADRAAAAFRHQWVSPAGRVVGDTPTGLTLAIAFDLLAEADQVRLAGDRLAQTVRQTGYRVKTGFAGTPLICDALVQSGHPDDAYNLLLCDTCPSWLYPITMGATTIWERWDALLPNGRVNPGEMTSFNHYTFGSVCDFLHRQVGGLAPAAPGYRRVRIAPIPGGGLTWASTAHLTPYGRVAVSWRRHDRHFSLHVDLPTGVEAIIELPDGRRHELAGQADVDFTSICRPADQDGRGHRLTKGD